MTVIKRRGLSKTVQAFAADVDAELVRLFGDGYGVETTVAKVPREYHKSGDAFLVHADVRKGDGWIWEWTVPTALHLIEDVGNHAHLMAEGMHSGLMDLMDPSTPVGALQAALIASKPLE